MSKKITITITEPQFLALAGAVAYYEVQDGIEEDPEFAREVAALNRLHDKIRDAYRGRNR